MAYNPIPGKMGTKLGTKRGRIILIGVVVVLATVLFFVLREGQPSDSPSPIPLSNNPIDNSDSNNSVTPLPTEIIATNLSIPWDIAFLPDDSLLVTERAGNLLLIEKNPDGIGFSKSRTSIKLPRAVPRGEGGLLGITLHPNFLHNTFIYIYMTTQSSKDGTKNAVFRYQYKNGKLSDEKTIISGIPGALYHDGGRMEFGPDGFLYITTGDAQDSSIAQDLKSLGGKILRLTDEGKVPTDNPFVDRAGAEPSIWSYGHRNPQGLAWDSAGNLWETEHGRSGITSGMDEINLIQKGKNYGWPDIEGDKTKTGMEVPALHSGEKSTWAPASAVFYEGSSGKKSLFFGGLKGEALYEAVLDGTKVKELKTHFHETYGRIRTVRLGPDNMLYLTTSNRDGRGNPVDADDRIIKMDPKGL